MHDRVCVDLGNVLLNPFFEIGQGPPHAFIKAPGQQVESLRDGALLKNRKF